MMTYSRLQVVDKDALQLVGAVALMVSSNNFCKLPMQDGERLSSERGLTTAEDIVYWTDGTYSIDEVLNMEIKMLQGFDLSGYASPLDHLSELCAAWPLSDSVVSITLDLIVRASREYALLQLHPGLLAACCLYIALPHAPDPPPPRWTENLAASSGYPVEVLAEHASSRFKFAHELEVECRSIASRGRQAYRARLLV